jgi:hypothetical protein
MREKTGLEGPSRGIVPVRQAYDRPNDVIEKSLQYVAYWHLAYSGKSANVRFAPAAVIWNC